MEISVTAMERMLSYVDCKNTDADAEIAEVITALRKMCRRNTSGQLELEDMSNYMAHVLWTGAEDVLHVMSDMDEFEGLTDAETERVAVEVAASIDWRAPVFSDCSAGNCYIEDVLVDVAIERGIGQ